MTFETKITDEDIISTLDVVNPTTSTAISNACKCAKNTIDRRMPQLERLGLVKRVEIRSGKRIVDGWLRVE